MQIRSFSLDMAAQHSQMSRQSSTLTRLSAGPSPELSVESAWQTGASTQRSQISTASTASPAAASSTAGSAQEMADDSSIPPLLNLAKMILEKVMGVHFSLYHGKLQPDPSTDNAEATTTPAAPNTTPANREQSGWLITRQHTQEQEQSSFQANGSITTADGQVFAFQLNSSLQRSFEQTSESVRRLNAHGSIDPLMITLPRDETRFSGASVKFDLQANGQLVDLPFASQGGWLVWDKNHDGKMTDGRQLFGPQSGNGFADLARQDSNHDQVIDSSDPVFADLKVWTGMDSQGKAQLASLSSLQIGAILLPSIDTPFSLRDSDNQSQGEVRRSGVYLTEQGQAGLISQVDVSV
ncbi:hypothetical protein [Paludibacterium sp. B53371]|uniref:hypothetical protein n=1 Tax=Paludibacterium sp. B53371 TaxID=2806263 RepID=UPI001C050789|nr:hypothetical protein [Paludibacterium sp. B53371]